jgi:hypothetical protein
MDNPLSKLALDYWYQVLMVVGIVVFLLCGAGLLKAFPILPTAMLSLGCFFIGLGEWINHPQRTAIRTVFPAGIITGHPRSANALGIGFDLLGAGLIGFGLYRLFA